MSAPKEAPADQANRSGFPFQIVVRKAVEGASFWHHWNVVESEVATSAGFADLVLQKQHAVAVIDCKRQLDGTWVFLSQNPRKVHEGRFLLRPETGAVRCGECRILLDLDLPQAEYCCMPTSGPNRQAIGARLLEATARDVIAWCAALAEGPPPHRGSTWGFIPMIVTNARLVTGEIANSDDEGSRANLLEAGTIPGGDLTLKDVEAVCFRKSLSTDYLGESAVTDLVLSDWVADMERTILVVRASSLCDVLARLVLVEHGNFDVLLDPNATGVR